MRKLIWLLICVPLLLQGCSSAPGSDTPTGLIFDRGNGSVWGNQLYIHLTKNTIITARYIPEGSAELMTLEQLPIPPEQWQLISQALQQLKPEREKPSLLEKLFPKQDGGDYRRLTLIYGQKEITCRWPVGGEQLEALLEQLIREVSR